MTIIQAAWAATREKGSYLQAQFLRVKNRRGLSSTMDLGGRYFVDRDKDHVTKSLLRCLRDLGVVVAVKAT